MGVLRAGGYNIKSDDYVATRAVTDMTGSRSFGSTYTNTTGKTMFVVVTFDWLTANLGDNAYIQASIDGVVKVRTGIVTGIANLNGYDTFILPVPPNSTYMAQKYIFGVGTTLTLIFWIEAS